MITQKPSLLKVADKIMMVANGTIALFGTRDQVLQKLAERNKGTKEIEQ